MHTSSTKGRARKLRLEGYSYAEISRDIKVSKSTLHTWLSDIQMSDSALKRLYKRRYEPAIKALIKRNKMQTHLSRQRANTNQFIGRGRVNHINHQGLLLIGAALYWGEGYKKAKVNKYGKKLTNHPISLSNSDPDLLRLFIRFLHECMNIDYDLMKISLHLYDHINEDKAIEYWQTATGLPRRNFTKTIYDISISSQRRKKFNRLPYGTAQVMVHSTEKFHQIMGLIEGLIVQSKGSNR